MNQTAGGVALQASDSEGVRPHEVVAYRRPRCVSPTAAVSLLRTIALGRSTSRKTANTAARGRQHRRKNGDDDDDDDGKRPPIGHHQR